MKDELLRKIQRVLDRRITNEAQVVYLLVEIRKLMERESYQDPALRTLCNWIVHTGLSQKSDGSTFILTEFDRHFVDLFEHHESSDRLEHISLGAFREGLSGLFQTFGLSAKYLNRLSEWKKFSALYCAIVSECPIVFAASRTPLKYVQQVELVGVSSGLLTKDWFVVNWRITLRDGRQLNWGFHFG